MNKLVSVIIPTYKGYDTLYRAINSVCRQTYNRIEIIVVDDNNPKTQERKLTEEVVDKFRDTYNNIIYICHNENKNGAVARNTGFANSKGDYICFLDDDDFMLLERVEKAVNILEKEGSADICFFNVLNIQDGIKKASIHTQKLEENAVVQLLNNPGMIGTGSNLFFRRIVFERVKGFDERFIRYQDVEFMGRALSNFKAIWVNETTLVRSKNRTNNRPNIKKLKEMQLLLIEQIKKNMSVQDEETIRRIVISLSHNLFSLAINSNVSRKDMLFVLDYLKEISTLSKDEKIKYYLYCIRNSNTNAYIKLRTIKKSVRKNILLKNADYEIKRIREELKELQKY